MKKESCSEAKFYSYWMQIISHFKEEELKVSLSRKKGERFFWFFVLVSFILTCGGGLVTKSCLTLVTPWTVASQAPLPMGILQVEYWSGLPCPPPGDFPNQVSYPSFLHCRWILYRGALILSSAAAAAKLPQLCPTLCSPPGSPVPGILQARTLEWVAISFSKIRLLSCTQCISQYSLLLIQSLRFLSMKWKILA